MNPHELCIRPVFPPDNQVLAALIRGVLVEMGVPQTGTALEDASLDRMYETYQLPRATYWVVADEERIWGGGGIAPLNGAGAGVCELQKMYFSRELRGLGWGARLIRLSLDRAKIYGFGTVYLETMPYMEAAQALYLDYGFRYLDHPRGDTGHSSCTVWMEKELDRG